ncbi:MAG: hypothetical protein QOK40_3506 [Miltoncostaeaceae bacterium]|nr:hypothetical protein [Miltoncostaeaceae bacterium]
MRLVGGTSVAIAAWIALGGLAGGRPIAPAPTSAGPPPAWVQTRAGDRWLAFSSYCWTRRGASGAGTGLCVDFMAPQHRRDLPTIRLRAGELVRFHLGFKPHSVSLNIGRRSVPLSNVAAPSWRVIGAGGAALLFATSARGDASYAARLVVRGARPIGLPAKPLP